MKTARGEATILLPVFTVTRQFLSSILKLLSKTLFNNAYKANMQQTGITELKLSKHHYRTKQRIVALRLLFLTL